MRTELYKIWCDTMKTPDGRYSRMSIIMATAWLLALYMAIHDFCIEGFRIDIWGTFVGIAIGTKLINANAEAINPTVKKPKEPEV